MEQDIVAVVLAAGKGTRMKSNKSKLVHKIYGKELVKRVVETDEKSDIKDIIDYNIILISDSKIDNLNIDSVEFKKLDNWQIEAYISKLIPGLNDIEISWLCKNSAYDLNRLDNEADKLNIFEVKDQKNIFKQMFFIRKTRKK